MDRKTEEAIKKLNKKEEKTANAAVDEILKLLEVDGTFALEPSQEGVEITLETNDTGIVIGYHGEVLEALQLVLSLVISKRINRFVRVSVDVGEYKKNRTDFLRTLAFQTKDRVLQEKKELPLPSLKSWERRIVHVLLQEDKEVLSESVGEGRDRTLVIKPR